MDFLGIGPLELVFIFIIILLIFGPDEIEKTGRKLGRFLRNLTMSAEWKTLQQASREIRNLPNRLMRQAEIEEYKKKHEGESSPGTNQAQIGKETTWGNQQTKIDAWTRQPKTPASPSPAETESTDNKHSDASKTENA